MLHIWFGIVAASDTIIWGGANQCYLFIQGRQEKTKETAQREKERPPFLAFSPLHTSPCFPWLLSPGNQSLSQRIPTFSQRQRCVCVGGSGCPLCQRACYPWWPKDDGSLPCWMSEILDTSNTTCYVPVCGDDCLPGKTWKFVKPLGNCHVLHRKPDVAAMELGVEFILRKQCQEYPNGHRNFTKQMF